MKKNDEKKYMNKLSKSEASTIFKLCIRIIHLKNNFRNIYKDVGEYLFGKCEKLKDLYIKYNILEYEEVFNSNITIERMKQILKFIELNLKQ